MATNEIEVIENIIEREKENLHQISREIWKKPELKFEEVNAHDVLTTALENYGFQVKKNYLLSTAFRAEYSFGQPEKGTTVALMCEYDAHPVIGHANGSNLVSEVAIGAAIAVKAMLKTDDTISGKVVVLGCPAAETGGGKIHLFERGAFKDIDAALLVHPKPINLASTIHAFRITVSVTYRGSEAHGGFPWEASNAMDAAVACYQNISVLKQNMKPLCRINGVITKGGDSGNVFPLETKLEFFIRAPTNHEIQDLSQKVKLCITSAAEGTGCTAKYDFYDEYVTGTTNEVLSTLFQECGEQFNILFQDGRLNIRQIILFAGCTDMGNISTAIPSLIAFYKIGNKQMNHTKAFATVAGNDAAQEPTLKVAKALALTVIKILRSPELVDEMKLCFEKSSEFLKEM